MPYLEKRRHTYDAVLTVPEDVREKFGLRFRKSTGETDRRKAQQVANQYVAGWKLQIEQARGAKPSNLAIAIEWREELKNLIGLDRIIALDEGVTSKAEEIAKKHGEAKGQEFVDIVTGKRTPSNILFDKWREQLTLEPKTIDQMVRDTQKLIDRFPILEDITDTAALDWIDELKAQGVTYSSLDRIAKFCRNYWGFLQHRKVVPKSHNPLSKIVKAPSGKAGRKQEANNPYSDDELLRLYAAAKEDQQLADFIRIAAYTGMRLEEVCSIKLADLGEASIKVTDSKTKAGLRTIPIHSKLLPLIDSLKAASTDGYLLSGLSSNNKYEKRGNGIGKRFQRLKTKLGFELRKHTAHSFRSTLMTKLENAGVPWNVAADIAGHDKPQMTFGVYSDGSTLETMRGAIELVKYPEGF